MSDERAVLVVHDDRGNWSGVVRQPEPELALKPWRCPSCSRLLAKAALKPGCVIQVKCDKCGTIAVLQAA